MKISINFARTKLKLCQLIYHIAVHRSTLLELHKNTNFARNLTKLTILKRVIHYLNYTQKNQYRKGAKRNHSGTLNKDGRRSEADHKITNH